MWHIIWIVIKCLFWASVIGAFYYSFIRIAIIGHGLFFPDMRRVDAHFGLSESWNSWMGYAGYYLLFLILIILPVLFIAFRCLC